MFDLLKCFNSPVKSVGIYGTRVCIYIHINELHIRKHIIKRKVKLFDTLNKHYVVEYLA